MTDLVKLVFAIIGGVILLVAAIFGINKLRKNEKFNAALKKHKEAIIKKVRREQKEKANEGATCEITLAPKEMNTPNENVGMVT